MKTVPLQQPVPDVVERLRGALARAESGELRSVAIVGGLAGGDGFTAYNTDDIFRMVAYLELLKLHLLNNSDREKL